MKHVVKRADIESAMGMIMAYEMWKVMRKEHVTVSEFFVSALGGDKDMIEMFIVVATRHAESIMRTVNDSEHETMEKIRNLDQSVHYRLIKEATVMSAIGEGIMLINGIDTEDVAPKMPLSELTEEAAQQAVKKALGGLDPQMVKMVSDMIVDGSYANVTPTKDIIMSLWMEGFAISILGPAAYLESKDDPHTVNFIKKAYEIFTVID